MPKQYIYEPWTAPIAVQKEIGCKIGTDYPHPIVKHDIIVKENKDKMAKAVQQNKDVKEGTAKQSTLSFGEEKTDKVSRKRKREDFEAGKEANEPENTEIIQKPTKKAKLNKKE